MGRRKIGIEKIDDTNKRMVTFSKRRSGIMSKATKLCNLYADIVVCIIIFSPGGRPYTFGNSPLGVCNVGERFLEEQTKNRKEEDKNVHKSKNSTQYRNKAGVGSGSSESSDSFWWDNIDIEEFDSVDKLKSARQSLAELKQNLSARKEKLTDKLKSARQSLAELKQNLSARKEKLTAAASSPLSSSSTTEDRIVEDTATTITEKHEAGKSCSKDHPNLDLSLNLGWQFVNGKDEAEEDPPLLRSCGRDLVEPSPSHPSQIWFCDYKFFVLKGLI
ncbi:hypothetical protein MKX01_036334 [Papaver californicum]|nr:hypothetical protein MKX01_036334 [Papaver californicum]